jgi:insertion element IS1 protein InsB
MLMQVLHGPHCQGTASIRHGTTRQGQQRSCCQETGCAGRTCLWDSSYAGPCAEGKQQSVAMALNASGIRDTARVLHVSPTTVIKELKKKEPELQPVHHGVLAVVHPEPVEVEIWRADELEVGRGLSSERDERWSLVQAQAHPRGLWPAMAPHTGKGLAYVFGRRKASVFLRLQALLEPFGIPKASTAGGGASERPIDAEPHPVGQENTQQIESKPSKLRTRIKRVGRRTLGCSKTEQMHALVIGLFMKRYEFGRAL